MDQFCLISQSNVIKAKKNCLSQDNIFLQHAKVSFPYYFKPFNARHSNNINKKEQE